MMMSQVKGSPTFICESQVEAVLTWPMVNEAVEEALKSICQSTEKETSKNLPYSNQPARNITSTENKKSILLAMPGYIGNYNLGGNKFNTLGCKLVTMATNNSNLEPPMPNILANIMLFDDLTGKLKCVMEATEITARRTASASVVATKYLYFERPSIAKKKPILAIIGCGVQGRSHAMGMCHTFDFAEIKLYNRTVSRAHELSEELEKSKKNFLNTNVVIRISQSIEEALADADVIVTATFTSDPIIQLNMLKSDVHINAVGAGSHHHSELSEELYLNCSVYVDNWASAKTELKNLKAKIVGEVGEVIINPIKIPSNGVTVFQSMGMAVEDAAVAQSVWEALQANCS